jgi:predicted NAD/FAD-dependent oxidoreductase
VVIGAGLSGLVAAHLLAEAGLSVRVVEKSRGFGGRMATRHFYELSSSVKVDHGAQYFTARDPKFKHFLEPFIKQGIVKVWTDEFPIVKDGILLPVPEDKRYPRYVCPQGMNHLGKVLAEKLTVHRETRVTHLDFAERFWELQTDRGEVYSAEVVLSAIPAPQFLELGRGIMQQTGQDALIAQLESVRFDPSLAVMAVYGPEVPLPDWKGLMFRDNPFLSWISLDSSKREANRPLSLVLHSTAEFAHQYLAQREQSVPILLQQAAQYLGDWVIQPVAYQVQSWRYALPTQVLDQTYLKTHTPGPLFWSGDWCGGPKVEGAFLSGWAAGEAILECYA